MKFTNGFAVYYMSNQVYTVCFLSYDSVLHNQAYFFLFVIRLRGYTLYNNMQ